MAIKGLKVENGAVFSFDELTDRWERAGPGLIPDLEELLRKLESFSYSGSNQRENIVFEKEFDVGLGSVKSRIDEDGDLVYTLQKDDQLSDDDQLDEDLDFEQPLNCSSNATKPNRLPGLETALEIPLSLDTGKGRASLPGKPIPINETAENTTPAGHGGDSKLLNYRYTKRIKCKGPNASKAALASMFKLFDSPRYHTHSPVQGSLRAQKISYIRKDVSNAGSRLNAGLIKCFLRYNRLYKSGNPPESEFYLEKYGEK